MENQIHDKKQRINIQALYRRTQSNCCDVRTFVPRIPQHNFEWLYWCGCFFCYFWIFDYYNNKEGIIKWRVFFALIL